MFTSSDRNYLLNTALVAVGVVCIFTGIFYDDSLRFAHEISGYLMAILILLHLVFHFQWVKGATRSILADKKKLLAFVLTLAVSVGICVVLFVDKPINHRERDNFRRPPRGINEPALPGTNQ